METYPAAAGLTAIATVHETIELVPVAETDVAGGGGAGAGGEAGLPKARGKWHEKFGRGR
jgi:hypothetical protein